MLDWLTSQGFRVTLSKHKVCLQRGAFYAEYGSIKAAFLAHDGPYTSILLDGGMK